MDRTEEMFYRMSPEQLDRMRERLLDEINLIHEEQEQLRRRKKRFDEAIDTAIKKRADVMVEKQGQAELIRLMLNDEVPFELGPVDGSEEADNDWAEDDEKLLLPMHLGGCVRQIDEYRVPPELAPDDEFLMANVLPY